MDMLFRHSESKMYHFCTSTFKYALQNNFKIFFNIDKLRPYMYRTSQRHITLSHLKYMHAFLGLIKYAVIIVEISNINVIKEVKLNLHFPLPFSNLVYNQTIR